MNAYKLAKGGGQCFIQGRGQHRSTKVLRKIIRLFISWIGQVWRLLTIVEWCFPWNAIDYHWCQEVSTFMCQSGMLSNDWHILICPVDVTAGGVSLFLPDSTKPANSHIQYRNGVTREEAYSEAHASLSVVSAYVHRSVTMCNACHTSIYSTRLLPLVAVM